jgi:hypothetical protein
MQYVNPIQRHKPARYAARERSYKTTNIKAKFSFPTPMKCKNILSLLIQLLIKFPKWRRLKVRCMVDYEIVCPDSENAENVVDGRRHKKMSVVLTRRGCVGYPGELRCSVSVLPLRMLSSNLSQALPRLVQAPVSGVTVC